MVSYRVREVILASLRLFGRNEICAYSLDFVFLASLCLVALIAEAHREKGQSEKRFFNFCLGGPRFGRRSRT